YLLSVGHKVGDVQVDHLRTGEWIMPGGKWRQRTELVVHGRTIGPELEVQVQRRSSRVVGATHDTAGVVPHHHRVDDVARTLSEGHCRALVDKPVDRLS